jgi:hypothetical protein
VERYNQTAPRAFAKLHSKHQSNIFQRSDRRFIRLFPPRVRDALPHSALCVMIEPGTLSCSYRTIAAECGQKGCAACAALIGGAALRPGRVAFRTFAHPRRALSLSFPFEPRRQQEDVCPCQL